MTDERWVVVLLVAVVAFCGWVVFLYQTVLACALHTPVRTFCNAADCPDYRITAVSDCLTPLSQAKAPILFQAMGIYIIQILPVAKIGKK